MLMKPVELFTVIGTDAVPPTATENVAAVEVSVKLSVVSETVRLTVVEVPGEFVGVIVIVDGPDDAIVGVVEMVKVVVMGSVPSKLTVCGLKLHVAPVGSPEQLLELKLTTMAVEPATGVSVKIVEVELPAETELGLSVPAESAKSGWSRAFHAVANTLASTEPRPVTRLYPVVVSALVASNPKTPADGHITSAGCPAGVPDWQ